MLEGENWGLMTIRNVEIGKGFDHVFAVENIVQLHTVSNKEVNYLFPLYLYPSETTQDQTGSLTFDEIKREPNINPAFTKVLSERIGKTPTPEEIFCYIYAVFHAPWYREKYAEFLRLDFPRVPLPEDKSTFERYCQIGRKLVALHLMEVGAHGNAPNGFPPTARGNDDEGTLPCAPALHRFEGDGDNVVEKIDYKTITNAKNGDVYINKTQYFENVSTVAWNFAIGGYQPAQKWLKDRKNRQLDFDDITHYQQMINALDATAELMGEL